MLNTNTEPLKFDLQMTYSTQLLSNKKKWIRRNLRGIWFGFNRRRGLEAANLPNVLQYLMQVNRRQIGCHVESWSEREKQGKRGYPVFCVSIVEDGRGRTRWVCAVQHRFLHHLIRFLGKEKLEID